MYRIKLVLIAALFTIAFNFGVVAAHPGRTDSRGGHHCWTNCKKWGHKTGSWHKHNSGKSKKSSKSNKKTSKKKSKKSSKKETKKQCKKKNKKSSKKNNKKKNKSKRR